MAVKCFSAEKHLRRGGFADPEHFNHRRVEPPWAAEPKNKSSLSEDKLLLFLVETTELESVT